MDPFIVKGKIIFITGASGHLGMAMSHRLAESGAILLLNSRTESKLAKLCDELPGDGHNILPFDITDEAAVDRAISYIAGKYDRLDGLVNNSNQGMAGTLDTITWDQSNYSATQNITAPLMLSIKLRAMLEKSESPAIVNIASMYGMVSPDSRIYGDSGANNPAYYGAAKAGMIQLTRYMACHLAESGIRVNAISPGPFPPPSIKDDNPEFHDKLCDKVPLGRIGKAEELGPVLQFLLSPAASYLTGVNIPVDGGWTAW